MTIAWHVVQSKPRLEDAAKRDVQWLGFETFMPWCREAEASKPVLFFPGYLFARFDVDTLTWTDINRAPGVLGVLANFEGVPLSIADHFVSTLQDEQANGGGSIKLQAPMPPVRQRLFVHGQWIRVRSGPFSGFQGVFDCYARNRIKVLLDVVYGKIKLTLSENDVESLSQGATLLLTRR